MAIPADLQYSVEELLVLRSSPLVALPPGAQLPAFEARPRTPAKGRADNSSRAGQQSSKLNGEDRNSRASGAGSKRGAKSAGANNQPEWMSDAPQNNLPDSQLGPDPLQLFKENMRRQDSKGTSSTSAMTANTTVDAGPVGISFEQIMTGSQFSPFLDDGSITGKSRFERMFTPSDRAQPSTTGQENMMRYQKQEFIDMNHGTATNNRSADQLGMDKIMRALAQSNLVSVGSKSGSYLQPSSSLQSNVGPTAILAITTTRGHTTRQWLKNDTSSSRPMDSANRFSRRLSIASTASSVGGRRRANTHVHATAWHATSRPSPAAISISYAFAAFDAAARPADDVSIR